MTHLMQAVDWVGAAAVVAAGVAFIAGCTAVTAFAVRVTGWLTGPDE